MHEEKPKKKKQKRLNFLTNKYLNNRARKVQDSLDEQFGKMADLNTWNIDKLKQVGYR